MLLSKYQQRMEIDLMYMRNAVYDVFDWGAEEIGVRAWRQFRLIRFISEHNFKLLSLKLS